VDMDTNRDGDDGDDFLRKLTFPEEDRHLFTTAPWQGGFRWFKSPNVVPIEQWRRKRGHRNQPNGDLYDPAA
jgi:hypothetical protein